MPSILQVYQTEVDWLALTALDSGERVTFAFDHEPTSAEVEARAAAFSVLPESPWEVEAEDGTVV